MKGVKERGGEMKGVKERGGENERCKGDGNKVEVNRCWQYSPTVLHGSKSESGEYRVEGQLSSHGFILEMKRRRGREDGSREEEREREGSFHYKGKTNKQYSSS